MKVCVYSLTTHWGNMMDNRNEEKYIVGGFEFHNKEEMEAAKKEQEGFDYLKRKVDLSNPVQVLHIYNKLLEKELFQTPVGYSNLLGMQSFLKGQGSTENKEIKNIPVIDKKEKEIYKKEVLDSNSKKKKKNYRQSYKSSLILNIALVIVILLMFYISYTGENATILNYETKIVDRYAQWEQELVEREKAVQALENK